MKLWHKTTIGDFLTLQRGHDLTDAERADGNIPVFGAAGKNGFHNTAIAKGPGIVVGRSGGSFGQVHFSEVDFWPHNTALYVTDFKGNDPRFTFYLLRSLDFERLNSGSAQPSLNRNFVYPVQISVPEVSEQKNIAKVLSTLDAKIDLNRRLNAELEAMAKLLYDYWFVQFDFPISAVQAAAMGKPELEGKPYRASGGKMVHNAELKREIPEGWEVGNLESLGTIIGGSTPSTKSPENFELNGVPWITPKDLSNNANNRFIDRGEISLSQTGVRTASLKTLPTGSVLLSSRAPIGYLAVARNPVTTNQGFKSFVPDKGFPSDFIYLTLKHFMKLIEANASGSTFKEVSGGTLKVIKIQIPNMEIVRAFSDVTAPLSQQQSVLEQQTQHLTQLRDWLLPMLMNGQVTVGDSAATQEG
jgi:type I restriction enzyme S subunit